MRVLPQHDWVQRMSIRYIPADLKIERADVLLNIKTEPARMDIRTKNPDIRVEWTHVWEDLGLERQSTVIRKTTAKFKREYLDGVAQKARDGDRLANLAAGEKNAISNIAWESMFRNRKVEVELEALPREGPRFDVTIYPPDIEVRPGKVEVTVVDEPLRIDVRLGGVEIKFAPRPLVDITL